MFYLETDKICNQLSVTVHATRIPDQPQVCLGTLSLSYALGQGRIPPNTHQLLAFEEEYESGKVFRPLNFTDRDHDGGNWRFVPTHLSFVTEKRRTRPPTVGVAVGVGYITGADQVHLANYLEALSGVNVSPFFAWRLTSVPPQSQSVSRASDLNLGHCSWATLIASASIDQISRFGQNFG